MPARALHILLASLIAWMLASSAFPQPCLGNGRGGACSVTSCACVAGCSCHADHLAERSPTVCHPGRLRELAKGDCHGPHQFPHVTLKAKKWHALLPDAPMALGIEPPARERHLPAPDGAPERATSPPVRPPEPAKA